jgi:hypothetical protein
MAGGSALPAIIFTQYEKRRLQEKIPSLEQLY